MDEDFDFFADLDDDATPRRKSDELHEEWLAALESSDIEQINRTLNKIEESMATTWAQIVIYRDVPSQKKRWQTEEWLPKAMNAHGFYSRMFKSLERHRTLLVERNNAREVAKALEAKKTPTHKGDRGVHA